MQSEITTASSAIVKLLRLHSPHGQRITWLLPPSSPLDSPATAALKLPTPPLTQVHSNIVLVPRRSSTVSIS